MSTTRDAFLGRTPRWPYDETMLVGTRVTSVTDGANLIRPALSSCRASDRLLSRFWIAEIGFEDVGMRKTLVMLAVILPVTLGSPAHAHHSHFYDECKSITIEGRVERVEFKNPHNLLVLRLDNGTGYIVDWINLTRLTNAGIIVAAKQAVVSGARLVVTGFLIRNVAEIRGQGNSGERRRGIDFASPRR